MTLSNTAVPIYYGRFQEAVLRGDIPISKEIAMEMERIDALIADPFYYYDDQAINGFIAYVEGELTLTDGSNVKMLESFKLWSEQIFGWYFYETISVWEPYLDGRHGGRNVQKKVLRRLTTKQYLIVARGAAKSMYASFIHAYFLIINPETTHQVTIAPTLIQAQEVISPLATAIKRAPGPVFQFMTQGSLQNTTGDRKNRLKLASTKKGVENFITGSLLEARPMSKDKLQGMRPRIATIDEWLSGDTREDVLGAVEQGASKHEDYLILAISSEGTVRNGVGDTMKMELSSILRGEMWAPHVSIWHYKLDDKSEVDHPDLWVKAQPNLQKTVSYETYHRDVERMKKAPSTYNDIMAKRFGLPMEGYTHFFTYEETLRHDHVPRFRDMPCALGADLSQGDDFCAFTFLFPLPGDRFGVHTRSYITELTLMKLQPAPRQKYDEFRKEGSLIIMDGSLLDMLEVYADLMKYAEDQRFDDILAFGYDPYNSTQFVEEFVKENGGYGVVKVPQGARTESVPLGELKKLSEKRLLLFNQKLMEFAMGNAMVLEDTNGNRKLYKKRAEEKIDNVASTMDAYIAYKANQDAFL